MQTTLEDERTRQPRGNQEKTNTAEILKTLRISNLSLSVSGRTILHNVNLEVMHGDFVCFIGPNGSGKTALFHSIAGRRKQYTGEISIAGRAINGMGAKERAQMVAYVPQEMERPPAWTVRKFMKTPRNGWRSLMSGSNRDGMIAEAMALTGTTALADRKIDTLSSGERRKVMIALAIAQEAQVMLFDEPTANLDCGYQQEIIEIISHINRNRGMTIAAATHDINLALQASGSVVALSGGKVAWKGTPIELLEPGRLRGIFNVTFERYFPRDDNRPPLVAPAEKLFAEDRKSVV